MRNNVFTVEKNFRSLVSSAAVAGTLFAAVHAFAGESAHPSTFCNPVDLNYRFSLKEPFRREAADPVILWWKGKYWLFASKSGGYWYSDDFFHWKFVTPTGLPLENYAPAAFILRDRLYYTAGSAHGMFTTDDPVKGEWRREAKTLNYTDPAVFVDDDDRVYMYSGTSAKDPIQGVELDSTTFAQIGEQKKFIYPDPLRRGWELKNPGASDTELKAGVGLPFIEGAWMTKHKGTYYLEYAGPGTERKWYGDGVYTGPGPLGPFTYQDYSPYSLKATGFITGTGHGNTFPDAHGNYWHSTCGLIGVNQSFERRVTVFPASFLPNASGPDQLVCNTYLGDYPQYLPGKAPNPEEKNSPRWMLLSLNNNTTVSSALDGHPGELASDENIATWWSARTGNPGEWLAMDLGKVCEIRAIQTNFADQGATTLGRLNDAYRYLIEVSDDAKNWTVCLSRADNERDGPHDYAELEQPVRARHVRIKNIHTPAGMNFSISGLRLFGSGLGQAPAKVETVGARRLPNRRQALVNWTPAEGAQFYIIRYGISPDRLFHNAQVYGETSFEITGLTTDLNYYFTVDAINESGVTKGVSSVKANDTVLLDRSGWTASASHSNPERAPVAYAIDGDPSTRWGTGRKQESGMWFQVDMGADRIVYGITQSNTPGDHPRGYEIYLSNDGTTWGEPVARVKPAGSSSSVTIPPQSARYIRLVGTGSTNGNWWSISEFNVIGAP